MTDLPDRKLLRVDEVALFFDVTERTIRLWIEHGHLQAEKYNGRTLRILKESVETFRLKGRTTPA